MLSFGFGPDYVAEADRAVVDGPMHDGEEVDIDLPSAQHVRNFGAPADGKGLCVFASITMAARWHHIRALEKLLFWELVDGKLVPRSRVQQGGGWPEKVDQILKQEAPGLNYVQLETSNANDLAAFIERSLAEGRMVCGTYGYGERYQMQTIYHMVCFTKFNTKWGTVLDNNFPGTFEWMSRAELLRRCVHPSGKGWVIAFIVPPPPPIPHN
jgi:hypothetical protein